MNIEDVLAQNNSSLVSDFAVENQDLPPIPTIAAKALRTLSDPNVSADSLGRVLEKDYGFTSALLTLANSAYFHRIDKVHSVREAIAIVGLTRTRNLIFSKCAKDLFAEYGDVEKGLWEHSVAVAVAAKTIALKKCMWYRDEAFVAGLMHDVGAILLNNKSPSGFKQLLELAEEEQVDLLVVEKDIFSCTHMAVGHALTAAWGLSEYIQKATLLHHHIHLTSFDNTMSQQREVIYLVALADLICKTHGIGSEVRSHENALWTHPGALIFGVQKEEFDTLSAEIEIQFEKERQLFMG